MLIDGMNLKKCLERVIELTRHDAAEQHIDFNDPANLFTVWAGRFFDRVQYCGSRQSLDAALRLAGDHKNLKELYVAYAGPKAFGIMLFEKSATLM
jgi:hypothetical protein